MSGWKWVRGGVGFMVCVVVASIWEYVNTILVDGTINTMWVNMYNPNSIFPNTLPFIQNVSLLMHAISIIMIFCGIVYFLYNVIEIEVQDDFLGE